jgi:uncharacterized damage-inducible protein DinB
MDATTCRLLAEYNRTTNRKMDALIGGLDPGLWARELGGYFSSIRSLCNHLYICDFNWLKRFSGARAFSFIRDPVFRHDLKFGTTVLEDIAAYREKRLGLDGLILDFAEELGAEDMDRRFTYSDSSGSPQDRMLGGAILHFFNHQTHHRGMVSVYLEILGIENDFCDLIELV